MQELKVTGGVQYFNLNGRELAFDPGDMNFADEFLTMVENLEKTMEDSEEIRKVMAENPREVFRIVREKDRTIRAEIDHVFGEGTSKAIYTGNLTSLADGLPVWLNFCLAIMDIMEENARTQRARSNPRLQKYMAKYEQYQKR